MKPQLYALSALAVATGAVSSAYAQGKAPTPPDEDDRGTFTFVWENDWFGDQDRNYTNGLRLGWVSGQQEPEGIDRTLARLLTGEEDTAKVRRGFALGHSIYTPRDIGTEEFLPDQHPYAGFLYGEAGTLIETGNSLDQIALRVGLFGPSAGGEWVQNEYHSLIGAETAEGWDNQVRDEAGVDIIFDRRYRALTTLGSSDFGADLIPNVGATLGTLNTNARAGLTLRIGQDLKNDFGPPRIRPSLAGAGYFAPDDGFSWYVFGGVEGRYVAHDYILDGSLFRDDVRTVDSKDFVHDLQAGLVVQWGGVHLGLTYVERSKQFEQQAKPQRYGAVSWSFKY